jgi:hypothetical protein
MNAEEFKPEKITKAGKRKQKMFLRKAIARKLKVPASSLKGKTYNELMEILEDQDIVVEEGMMPVPVRGRVEAGPIVVEEGMMPIPVRGRLKRGRPMRPRRPPPIRPDIMASLYPDEEKYPMDDQMDIPRGFRHPEDEPRPKPVLRRPPAYDMPIEGMNPDLDDQNAIFNDNSIRGVNSYSSFIPTPSVPIRRGMSIRTEVGSSNIGMRRDPDPSVQPQPSIAVQSDILEGPADRMPEGDPEVEILRDPQDVAQNNSQNIDQGNFMRDARSNLRRTMNLIGAGDEFAEEVEEKDMGVDIGENVMVEGGMTNNERTAAEMKRLEMRSKANLSRDKYKDRTKAWNKFMKMKAIEDGLMRGQSLHHLRGTEIPWRQPDRTYANNYVGLIRNSNRSMELAVHELIP